MDLTSRKAVRDGMIKYGFIAPDMTVHEFVEDELPSVPAVPLDKLCEWLDKNNDFVPFCADDKADCNSCELEGAECIKKRIMLWMEGLDAEKEI